MSLVNKRTGGKKGCKYYTCCGTKDNCARCKGFQKKKTSNE